MAEACLLEQMSLQMSLSVLRPISGMANESRRVASAKRLDRGRRTVELPWDLAQEAAQHDSARDSDWCQGLDKLVGPSPCSQSDWRAVELRIGEVVSGESMGRRPTVMRRRDLSTTITNTCLRLIDRCRRPSGVTSLAQRMAGT